jgi:hypothetical protein
MDSKTVKDAYPELPHHEKKPSHAAKKLRGKRAWVYKMINIK